MRLLPRGLLSSGVLVLDLPEGISNAAIINAIQKAGYNVEETF
jgi:hypothetical protein